ncbi:hypothetical protein NCS52_01006000 [Fusarium sp. LHS14.1]|nr:hypothetical protein NCS52_01006000 [Fusarium sp. LHS14.1]
MPDQTAQPHATPTRPVALNPLTNAFSEIVRGVADSFRTLRSDIQERFSHLESELDEKNTLRERAGKIHLNRLEAKVKEVEARLNNMMEDQGRREAELHSEIKGLKRENQSIHDQLSHLIAERTAIETSTAQHIPRPTFKPRASRAQAHPSPAAPSNPSHRRAVVQVRDHPNDERLSEVKMEPGPKMKSGDIRERFRNDDECESLLQVAHPALSSATPRHSGIDCLLTVVSRIYSHLMLSPNGLDKKEWFAAAESQNPILTHACNMFRQGDQKANDIRMMLFEALSGSGISGTESFHHLHRSPLMARTFWGQSELVLFDPMWNEESFAETRLTRQQDGEKSLVQVLRFGQETVQGRLDELFGKYRSDDGRSYNILAPARPNILRVEFQYHSSDASHRPTFDSFRKVDFPVWTWHNEEGGAYFDTTGRVPNVLIAVVRHRHESFGHDLIRTYRAYGVEILPEYEPGTFTPGSWSLEDAGPNTYTLFYGRFYPGMPLAPFPEVDNQVNDIGFDHHGAGSQ